MNRRDLIKYSLMLPLVFGIKTEAKAPEFPKTLNEHNYLFTKEHCNNYVFDNLNIDNKMESLVDKILLPYSDELDNWKKFYFPKATDLVIESKSIPIVKTIDCLFEDPFYIKYRIASAGARSRGSIVHQNDLRFIKQLNDLSKNNIVDKFDLNLIKSKINNYGSDKYQIICHPRTYKDCNIHSLFPEKYINSNTLMRKNEILILGDSKFIGNMKYSKVNVLPADDPKKLRHGALITCEKSISLYDSNCVVRVVLDDKKVSLGWKVSDHPEGFSVLQDWLNTELLIEEHIL